VNVCRGLFERHKLIFSFLIAISINKRKELFEEAKWNVLLRGAGVLDKGKQPANPDKISISSDGWDLICYLDASFPSFNGITAQITNKKLL